MFLFMQVGSNRGRGGPNKIISFGGFRFANGRMPECREAAIVKPYSLRLFVLVNEWRESGLHPPYII